MKKRFAMEKKTCQATSAWVKQQCSNCAFYKTQAELDESRLVANMRLASLPKEHQIQIADKYYKGEMPWLEECANNAKATPGAAASWRVRALVAESELLHVTEKLSSLTTNLCKVTETQSNQKGGNTVVY